MTLTTEYHTRMVAPERCDPDFPFGPEVFLSDKPMTDAEFFGPPVTEQEEEARLIQCKPKYGDTKQLDINVSSVIERRDDQPRALEGVC